MVVGDDELHAVEPPGFKAGDEGRPARARLSIRELHAQDLAPALAVDPDRDEDRLRLDHPVEPDLLVPRIEDQIGIRLDAKVIVADHRDALVTSANLTMCLHGER